MLRHRLHSFATAKPTLPTRFSGEAISVFIIIKAGEVMLPKYCTPTLEELTQFKAFSQMGRNGKCPKRHGSSVVFSESYSACSLCLRC